MSLRRTLQPSVRSPSAGFTLIEVLVALLVLSIGLLGLALLQGQGLKFNTDAYARTQITTLAYDIIERMRANAKAAEGGDYDVPTQTAAEAARSAYNACKSGSCYCDDPAGTTECSTSDLAKYDIGKWYDLQEALVPIDPDNLSTISRNDTTFTIVMRWRERGGNCGGVADLKCQTLVVEVAEL